MNKQEFSIFAAALRTYYPREKLLPNNEAMELWYRQLQDIDYNVAAVCLNKWVATEKWSPSIADIRQAAAEVTRGDIPDWGDGWGEVIKAIDRYGSYNEAKALASMSEITRKAVERVGFYNLCMSENLSADRANFRMIYEQLANREKTEAQVPEKIKNLIGTMQKKALESKQQNLIEENNEKEHEN